MAQTAWALRAGTRDAREPARRHVRARAATQAASGVRAPSPEEHPKEFVDVVRLRRLSLTSSVSRWGSFPVPWGQRGVVAGGEACRRRVGRASMCSVGLPVPRGQGRVVAGGEPRHARSPARSARIGVLHGALAAHFAEPGTACVCTRASSTTSRGAYDVFVESVIACSLWIIIAHARSRWARLPPRMGVGDEKSSCPDAFTLDTFSSARRATSSGICLDGLLRAGVALWGAFLAPD